MKQQWSGERLETFILDESTIEHLHRYALAKEYVKKKTVLDIACGEGYGSNLLAEEADLVHGVDIDEETIRRASAKYVRKNLSFKAGNACSIPFPDNHFDVVVSFETIEHVHDHYSMVTELKRVLKEDGILIISSPDRKNYSDANAYKNPFHVN